MTRAKGFGHLERRQAVAELLRDRGELLAVTGLGSPTYDVFAAGDHPGNVYLWGAMGGAAMVGLGLALAQPDRPVAVVTGDGEAMMGLGGFATICAKRPGNLTLVVLDNGHFGETGGQASHTGLGVSLRGIAQAAGFASAVELGEMDEVIAYRGELQKTDAGPRFAVVRIAPGNPPRALPARDGVFLKTRLRSHLGYAVV